MKLSEIVDGVMANASAGFMLDRPFVTKCLKKAVRRYCGYAKLAVGNFAPDEIHDAINAGNSIELTQDFDLDPSEYAIVQPLFDLYLELENAIMLEASRGLGVDVFGRTVSEIQQDVAMRESELPKAAFWEEVVTI